MRSSPLLALLLLAACSKTAEPAQIADFATGLGKTIASACVPANDGKRYVIDGYLLPSSVVSADADGASLNLYGAMKDGEGQGESVAVNVKEGSFVDFGLKDRKSSFRGDEATITDITLHTTGGDVKVDQRVGVVFDLDVIQHFQSGEVTACELAVVELRKL